MKRYAIIVAGGSGSRFGGSVPKQFQMLAGCPVLMRTIGQFATMPDVAIVVVLPSAQIDCWRSLCAKHGFTVPHRVVTGGDSRFQSVKNALLSLSFEAGDIVAVHDGVRPLASRQLIAAAYETAARCGSAVPATPVTDSMRILSDPADPASPSESIDRACLRSVQTPQAFRALPLLAAYDVPFSPSFTDDASVFEHSGGRITLMTGETSNIKITRPVDLVIAENLLACDER